MIAQAIGIGIIVNFIFTEQVGLYAGGLIVPGYIAFFWKQPFRIGVSFLVALITYAIVMALSHVIILYGRRRFMAAVIVGYVTGWLVSLLIVKFLPIEQDLRAIGYIIPGLIANDMVKQGIWRTVLAVLIVSSIVRVILLLMISS